jgi:hypothetical protein
MKSSLSFGIGVVCGALAAFTLFSVSRYRDRESRDAELAVLKEDLSLAQKSAARDRQVLESTLKQREGTRVALEAKPSRVAGALPSQATPANSVFESYLGRPVSVPSNLDPRYSPEEISAVFRDLVETLGMKVTKLGVDASEFPFVIHGRVDSTAGADFFKKVDAELRALPGYTYGGSLTGKAEDGTTYFALNIIPSSAYPEGANETIRRRLMIRMQLLITSTEKK